MTILAEECAEVIVEVSKCHRFGIDTVHNRTGLQHRKMLEQEIGDVLALIDVLVTQGVVDPVLLSQAKAKKMEKLHQWSGLFDQGN